MLVREEQSLTVSGFTSLSMAMLLVKAKPTMVK